MGRHTTVVITTSSRVTKILLFKIRSDMQRMMLQCVDQIVKGTGGLVEADGAAVSF